MVFPERGFVNGEETPAVVQPFQFVFKILCYHQLFNRQKNKVALFSHPFLYTFIREKKRETCHCDHDVFFIVVFRFDVMWKRVFVEFWHRARSCFEVGFERCAVLKCAVLKDVQFEVCSHVFALIVVTSFSYGYGELPMAPFLFRLQLSFNDWKEKNEMLFFLILKHFLHFLKKRLVY